MQSADATERAEAIVWLATHGDMSDAPLLDARLRDDNDAVRSMAEEGLWLLWSRSGNPAVDRMLAIGIEAMQAGRQAEAIEVFTQVVENEPAFAEGWNKRATAYFLAREYPKSIADCQEVLKLNPRHFGALSGLGQIYERLDQPREALIWFRRALEVNPNLGGVEKEIGRLETLLRQRSI